jgi:hypothetical protein
MTQGLDRRTFVKLAGLAATAGLPDRAVAAGARGTVAIAADLRDSIVSSHPAAWGLGRLRTALAAKGVTAVMAPGAADHLVTIASHAAAGVEDVTISPGAGTGETLVCSGGARGLAYALVELAERVGAADDAIAALRPAAPIAETPANRVRSVLRAFCSDVEDKPWFYDEAGWTGYLDLLAASRFNRLQFALGFGYDFPTGVTEDYFHFAYPYLVDVPGYDVRVEPLAPGERARNLAMLQFITRQAGLRGIDFQLGIWTHAYQWVDSPDAHHRIVGLTPETHAAYCRDALAMLLELCPDITGVTMRVHGESGIPEGHYDFWRTVFEAIAGCGRPFEIDMHAKGINQIMIDMAVATGKAVKVSPKYSAEHQGLGYHQADIRALEIPRPGEAESGTFSVSNGARRFTRYSYADLFRAGRRYDILFRRWPGTQRHTLNGDPAQAAAYGRTAHFCDAAGLEICEPLTFKGRDGSGHAGGRLAYINPALRPDGPDWAKFDYSYRLWGRTLYDPDADPEAWRRPLRTTFGAAAIPLEQAMAEASRVLMIFTTSHLPTASNRQSWYETYTNMPIVIGSEPPPYKDTPEPYCAATVSPLDPQLFCSAVDQADALLNDRPTPRYAPSEVAMWMEACATAAARALDRARGLVADANDPAFRRWEEDILIQIGLGRFFADKFRATVLYELFSRTGDKQAGSEAIACYRRARAAWAAMADRAKTVYSPDVSYGMPDIERWHWAARLPGIDRDLQAMRAAVAAAGQMRRPVGGDVIAAIRSPKPRRPPSCHHQAEPGFRPGAPLAVAVSTISPVARIELCYRHVNQAERWQYRDMTQADGHFRAEIDAGYTGSPFDLQYYFSVHTAEEPPVFYPAFDDKLANQPYFVVMRRT